MRIHNFPKYGEPGTNFLIRAILTKKSTVSNLRLEFSEKVVRVHQESTVVETTS